jgi:hypothetical protein
LDVDNTRKFHCKQIFSNIIPNIARPDSIDIDLIQSLFGTRFNPVYLTHSDTNETIPIMQGKLCSNVFNEWILLTILEKGIIYLSLHCILINLI